MQVDPIEHGPRDALLVPVDRGRRAGAGCRRVAVIAAGTGVHRRREHEIRRIRHRAGGPRNRHDFIFKRLAQDLKDARPEFGEFVEEEDAAMRHGDFAGLRRVPAAGKADIGNRVMRRAKGTRPDQRLIAGEHVGDRVNPRHVERFLDRHPREDRRERPRHQRLPRSRRPAHQDIMPARRRDFERAFGAFLSLDFGEIGRDFRNDFGKPRRCLRLDPGFAAEMPEEFFERRNREDGNSWDERRFFGVDGGDEDAGETGFLRPGGNRKNPADMPDRSVERQLADNQAAGVGGRVDNSRRRHAPDRDRQVERRPFFADVRRGEVDGHFVTRVLDPGVTEGGVDALAALLDREVGKADDNRFGERGKRRIDFNVDQRPVQIGQGAGNNFREHEQDPSGSIDTPGARTAGAALAFVFG